MLEILKPIYDAYEAAMSEKQRECRQKAREICDFLFTAKEKFKKTGKFDIRLLMYADADGNTSRQMLQVSEEAAKVIVLLLENESLRMRSLEIEEEEKETWQNTKT